jgi:hypothetical protein
MGVGMGALVDHPEGGMQAWAETTEGNATTAARETTTATSRKLRISYLLDM